MAVVPTPFGGAAYGRTCPARPTGSGPFSFALPYPKLILHALALVTSDHVPPLASTFPFSIGGRL